MPKPLAAAFTLLLVSTSVLADEPASIPVVRTWEELEALPPITVTDGVTVRLGIEANRVRPNGGCLVYCLTEGWSPNDAVATTGDTVGPVRIRVERRGEPRRLEERMHLEAEHVAGPGPYLYLRTIPVPGKGSYDVRVFDDADRTLAATTVEGQGEPLHPWFEFESPREDVQEQMRFVGQPIEEYVTAVGETVVVPHWESYAPFVRPEKPTATTKADEPTRTPLPITFPAKVDKGFKLRLRGETFEIRFDETTALDDPQYHLIARWWVNDVPFAPDQGLRRIQHRHRERLARAIREGDRDLDLHVAFDPERFGARTGDRIGVQLLYCPGGTQRVHDDLERLHVLRDAREHRFLSRMSNKVVFVVP